MSYPVGAYIKDQLYTRFIFNNYSSFVNLLLHLVRSYVVMLFTYVEVASVKLKKNKIPCHAVADKLLGKWSPRDIHTSEKENLDG